MSNPNDPAYPCELRETVYACGECGKPIETGCYCAECAAALAEEARTRSKA